MALSSESLGELCYYLQRYDESLVWLKEAEGIASEIAPEGDIVTAVFRKLSEVYLALNEVEKAGIDIAVQHSTVVFHLLP